MSPQNKPRLDRPPLVISTLTGSGMLKQAIECRNARVDLLEVRLDSLDAKARSGAAALLSEIRLKARLPILLTIRSSKEQGGARGFFKIPDGERKKLFADLTNLADWIDVEIESPIAAQVAKPAKKAGKTVILSYHDFKSAPDSRQIAQLVSDFESLPGDILKIAAFPKKDLEIAKFMAQCLALDPLPRVFIVMGAKGKFSRLSGHLFGCRLTYGYVGRSAAPGQVPVSEILRYRDSFKNWKKS